MAIVWSRVAWAISTAYTRGARVVNSTVEVDGFPIGCVYECVVAGTSAGVGPGPTGTDSGLPITDGGVTWRYKGPIGGEVIGLAPQFSTVAALEQVTVLGIADRSVGVEWFGDDADTARLYLAAHIAAMAELQGKGAVTAEGVGALSRSYSTAAGIEGDLGLTSYGAVFRRLQLATGAGMGFTA